MLIDVLQALGGAALDQVWVVTREPEVATLARSLRRRAAGRAGESRSHRRRRHRAGRGRAPGRLRVPHHSRRRAVRERRRDPHPGAGADGAARRGAHAVALGTGHQRRGCWRRRRRCGCASASRRSTSTWRRPGRCASSPAIVRLPGLGLDVDAPDDLRMRCSPPAPATESGRLLASWQHHSSAWSPPVRPPGTDHATPLRGHRHRGHRRGAARRRRGAHRGGGRRAPAHAAGRRRRAGAEPEDRLEVRGPPAAT